MSELENTAGYKDVLTGSSDGPAPEGGAAQIRPASAPELKTLAGVAVGTMVIAALYFGQDVLIPITLAVMLSFGCCQSNGAHRLGGEFLPHLPAESRQMAADLRKHRARSRH